MKRNTLYAIIALVIIIGGVGGGAAYWYFFMQPAPPENPYQVAIVFGLGGLGDLGFNDLTKDAADMAEADYNVNFTYSEPQTLAEFQPLFEQYAAHVGYSTPYDLIIGVGYEVFDSITAVAAAYPTQNFAVIDINWINHTELPNIAALTFNEEQGAFLVGALAGLRTTQDMVAFVGGKDEPLIHKFGAGYAFGANYTNPNIGVNSTHPGNLLFSYVGAWDDPTTGQSQAELHYDAGADICFAAAGGSGIGVIDAAIAKNGTLAYDCWSIGVDKPQMYLGVPTGGTYSTMLTSMLKRVDTAVYKTILAASIWDNFTGGLLVFDLEDGGIGWELNNDLLATPYKITTPEIDLMDDLATAVINGTIIVPTDFAWL
ncbi:MAG: BMP family protein [Candidatus Thorarchaeota archaeon]